MVMQQLINSGIIIPQKWQKSIILADDIQGLQCFSKNKSPFLINVFNLSPATYFTFPIENIKEL
jgi:hypothetical protein